MFIGVRIYTIRFGDPKGSHSITRIATTSPGDLKDAIREHQDYYRGKTIVDYDQYEILGEGMTPSVYLSVADIKKINQRATKK